MKTAVQELDIPVSTIYDYEKQIKVGAKYIEENKLNLKLIKMSQLREYNFLKKHQNGFNQDEAIYNLNSNPILNEI